MRFLRVKNWEEHQHYHDGRRPSWIKFYTALLNPGIHPKYAALTDAAKLTLHHLWLLAAECENRIPETWLNRGRLNMQGKPRLEELVAAGIASFSSDTSISDASDSCSPRVSVSVSHSPSASHELSSWQESAFESVWSVYPRRIGRKGALRHFKASVKGPEDLERLRAAMGRYLDSSTVKRGYIQHGSTWFNNWQDWENWTEPNDHRDDRNASRGDTGKSAGRKPPRTFAGNE